MFEERKYREKMGKDLDRFLLVQEETDLWIGISKGFFTDFLEKELTDEIKKYRNDLKKYISEDKIFQETLVSYLIMDEKIPEFIREMSGVASKAGVGPMASVAGAFSKIAGLFLKKKGIPRIIVENGGDIFVSGFDKLLVGIYAGKSPFSEKIGIDVDLQNKDFGICSSSGSFGHSLSFGQADVVTIISEDILLADALATAYCNQIKGREDIERAIESLKGNSEVAGALIIMDDNLAAFGNLEIVKI